MPLTIISMINDQCETDKLHWAKIKTTVVIFLFFQFSDNHSEHFQREIVIFFKKKYLPMAIKFLNIIWKLQS